MRTKVLAAGLAVVGCVVVSSGQAQADCVQSGTVVTCATDDADGFASGTDGLDVNIDEGVTVSGGRALDLDKDVTINNKGTLDGIGNDGIRIEEGSTVNNDGLIRSDNDEAIEAEDEDDITVNNTGTILATGSGGRAIEADKDLSVTNTSTGLIEAIQDKAIDAGDDLTVNNAGTIRSTEDKAIDAKDDATITNSGTITSTEDKAIQGDAGLTIENASTGLIESVEDEAVDAGDEFTLTNAGTVQSTDDKAVDAGNDATITNSGTIKSVKDKGIEGDDNLTITNTSTGVITSIEGEAIQAEGPGLTVINHGTIRAYLDDAIDGAADVYIENSGTIIGGQNDAIELDNGTVINSGTIISTSSSPGEVDAGIDFDAGGGTVINSGYIEGELGIGTDDANTATQVITNSGHIVGTGGTAIKLGAGADTLHLLHGSIVEGLIDFGHEADVDTLTLERGESRLVTFAADGAPEVINAYGAPTALINSGQTLATFDVASTAFGAERDALAQFNGSVNSGLHYRLTAGNPTTYIWAQAFGAKATVEASGLAQESNSSLRGGMSGFSMPFGSLGRGGLFAGYGESDLDTADGQHGIDTDFTFGGAYARLFLGAMYVDGTLTLGRADASSDRRVVDNMAAGGVATIRGTYDGWFVNPELTLGTELAVAKGTKLVPSVSVGYSGLYLDAFTETGSAAAVAFSARDVELIDGRAQLELRFQGEGATEGWRGALRAGVMGWSSVGDDDISGVLSNTTAFSVSTMAEDDSVAAFTGADMTFSPVENVQIYVGGEVSVDDASSIGLSGRAGAAVKF